MAIKWDKELRGLVRFKCKLTQFVCKACKSLNTWVSVRDEAPARLMGCACGDFNKIQKDLATHATWDEYDPKKA